MRVTYVRDARAERTSPSSDTRPAHVHAGKGPENARRRQPRRTGRSTRRDDAITTEPRPPMLIGRLQRGARSLRQCNRRFEKLKCKKKKLRRHGTGRLDRVTVLVQGGAEFPSVQMLPSLLGVRGVWFWPTSIGNVPSPWVVFWYRPSPWETGRVGGFYY